MMQRLIICMLALTGFAAAVMAQTDTEPAGFDLVPDSVYDMDFDTRLTWCKSQADEDAELGYEIAMMWTSQGGGRRAIDCAAYALAAGDNPGLGAQIMERMAGDISIGPPRMRAGYMTTSVDYWLRAARVEDAMRAADAALELSPDIPSTRIAKARALRANSDREGAEKQLSLGIGNNPDSSALYTERARVRLELNQYQTALMDAETALRLDDENIDAALVRGDIREAIRLDQEITQ